MNKTEKNMMLSEHLEVHLIQHKIKVILHKIIGAKINSNNSGNNNGNNNNKIFTIEIFISNKHIIIVEVKILLKNFLIRLEIIIIINRDKEFIKYIEINLVEHIIKKLKQKVANNNNKNNIQIHLLINNTSKIKT